VLVGALSTAVLSSAIGARTMTSAGPIPGITLLLFAGTAEFASRLIGKRKTS